MRESIVLLVLGALWAGYLGWYWRENRRTVNHRSDGIRAFSNGLGSLAGSASRSRSNVLAVPALAPRTAADAARRRREVLIALSAAALLTLFAAIGIGGVAVMVNVVADLALLAYCFALVQRRNDEAEREIKVTMLYPERVREAASAQPQAVNG
jgi:hypothetical protein